MHTKLLLNQFTNELLQKHPGYDRQNMNKCALNRKSKQILLILIDLYFSKII